MSQNGKWQNIAQVFAQARWHPRRGPGDTPNAVDGDTLS